MQKETSFQALAPISTLASASFLSLDLLTIPRGASLANSCAAISGARPGSRRLMAGAGLFLGFGALCRARCEAASFAERILSLARNAKR